MRRRVVLALVIFSDHEYQNPNWVLIKREGREEGRSSTSNKCWCKRLLTGYDYLPLVLSGEYSTRIVENIEISPVQTFTIPASTQAEPCADEPSQKAATTNDFRGEKNLVL